MSEKTDSLKISILNENEYPLWDEFVKDSPQGNFFNTIKWAEIISSVFNRLFKIIVIKKYEKHIAGIIVFENNKYGYKFITPVFLFPYSAPIFYRPIDEKYQKTVAYQLEISSRFIEYLRMNYKYWILDTHSTFQDLRAFQWAGCETEPIYDYSIELMKPNHSSEDFSQTTRKKIKQARDLDPEIFEQSDITDFIRMYIASYSRHEINPPNDPQKLEVILEKVLKLEQVKLYYIRLSKAVVASRIILIDDSIVYDLLAGSDDKSGLGSTYLVNHIINTFAPTHKYFNFLGAGHEQIEQFKRGFGGKLIHGFRIKSKAKFPFSVLLKMRENQLRFRRGL